MKILKRPMPLAVLVLLLAATGLIAQVAAPIKSYQFDNGNWFDGKGFKKRTFYSVGGVLSTRKPARVDEVVDLKGGFVIPPFGDAHTHNLDGLRGLDPIVAAYLAEGTFYVQVLGNHAGNVKFTRPKLNNPTTVDASYANGMLTTTYGHPFMVYEPMAMGIYNVGEAFRRVAEVKKSRLVENDAYWFLDSTLDVDAKWPKILATKPDLIKIGLLDAANYKKQIAAGDMVNKGLSPEVAEYVVKKAHAAGLRVYAHIETAEDFRIGVRVGVDGFAHAPYYDSWDGKPENKPVDELTRSDLKLAAKGGVVVIPTAARGVFRQTDYDANGKGTLNRERFDRVVERYRKVYNEMHKAGITIALGLDTYGTTVMPEILYFYENKIFDNLTLLKIAVEDTPRSIFPGRKIGRLQDGYEASFLVLKSDPIKDFLQVKNIEMRFKQGVFLSGKK